MNRYYVLRNEAWTHTIFAPADAISYADYEAHDGTKMKLVKVIEARTAEIADALYEAWQESEEQNRVHSRGCDEGECWCQ